MRQLCYRCEQYAFVIDGMFQCCDRPQTSEMEKRYAIELILNSEDYSGIYRLRNKETGKVYIGQSKNVASRLLSHKFSLLSGTCIPEIRADVKTYGAKSFEFEVLESVPADKLLKREAEIIENHLQLGKELYNRSIPTTRPPSPTIESELKERRAARLERRAQRYWYTHRDTISLADARILVAQGLDRKRRGKGLKGPVGASEGNA